MSDSDLPEHVRLNRAHWDQLSVEYAGRGHRAWASDDPTWGIWSVPERDLQVVPDVAGKDVIELGCGTAYWSAWLARRGACVVGIDNSAKQLETARALQREHGLDFSLIHGNAENVPLPDGLFDLALSEYGASIWCDPYRWIPEASRLLRTEGRLIFLCNSSIMMLTGDELGRVGEQLRRPYFGMHRFEWPDDHSVEFHLGYGNWIRVLRTNGFTAEALVELQAPVGAIPPLDHIPPGWAERWPS